MKFHSLYSLLAIFGVAFVSPPVLAQTTVDYQKDIIPILKNHCYQCHTGPKAKLENRPLYDEENFPKVVGTLIIPGNPAQSEVIRRIHLPPSDTEAMPPARRGKPLDTLQKAVLRKWIEEGAKFGTMPAPDLSSSKPDPAKVYTWTSDTGATLEAVFVSADSGTVTLRRADNGMVITIPKERFSPESKKLIEQFVR